MAAVSLRIVSLLPSATEILCLIPGAEKLLVGRSHECDYPASIQGRPMLTSAKTHSGASSKEIDAMVRDLLQQDRSLYNLDVTTLSLLKPDIILTQDLCDVCSIDLQTVERVASKMVPRPRVVNLNPTSIDDVLNDFNKVGEAIGMVHEAEQAKQQLLQQMAYAKAFVRSEGHKANIAFIEWMDPIFVGGHWTPQLIELAGGSHPLNAAFARSKQILPQEVIASNPDKVIICPCGFGFDQINQNLPDLEAQPWWQQLNERLGEGSVMIVDGNQHFNRPGPRLVEAFCWLVSWINNVPDVAPKDFAARSYRYPSISQ